MWVVDAGGHVVSKLDPEGKVLMQLGEAGVASTDRSHFHLPADVAFAHNGDVYVSDGYGSARIVKFTKEGRHQLEWGRRGTAPGEFGLPHNLAVDAEGRVYVADRDNSRTQVFDADGKFLDQWRDVGGVSSLFWTEGQRLWTNGALRALDGNIALGLPGTSGPTAPRSLGQEMCAWRNSAAQSSASRPSEDTRPRQTDIRLAARFRNLAYISRRRPRGSGLGMHRAENQRMLPRHQSCLQARPRNPPIAPDHPRLWG